MSKHLGALVVRAEHAGVGLGERHGMRGDRTEHRPQLQGRVDRAADLAERLQLLDRARQLARPLLDLAFEVGVGFLQLPRHLIEVLGERLQLVAGPDVDAAPQIAPADARGALLQRPDRADQVAREEQARQDGDREAEQQQAGVPEQGGVERREGLGERRLDEHVPVERRDRGVRGQHLAAVEAGRDVCPAGRRLRRSLARRSRPATCGSVERSVLRSTRARSGCATSRPSASTT